MKHVIGGEIHQSHNLRAQMSFRFNDFTRRHR
ncbi:MAG: hypothetical protein H6Q31_743 [Bacteroidetes bacterium]|jgi:hypothetical protein|nr:hypothetical protein [Bacteroidota bacterium]